MKRITITALAIISALLMASCATAAAEQAPEPTEEIEFAYVCDWNQHTEPSIIEQIAADIQAKQEEEAAREAEAAAEAALEEEWYEESQEWYSEPYSGSYSGDGFQQEGVRYHDGRTETYYSSNVLYHYRTSEWTVDDEGYYRDSDGYYVVAASDVAQGETLETSKGTAKVYDDGCDAGVTDFYTNF